MTVLKHGIQPFWFWNGELRDEEIQRQIKKMKEQGFHGFLIHPRQGMEVPYLSKMFFEKVRVAVEEAKIQGMEVWLYDEFPYPSGISGGKVTLEHPEYSCKELMKICQVYSEGETAKLYAPWGKVLMARAYQMIEGQCQWDKFIDLKEYVGSGYVQDIFQMSGLTKYNKKRYFQGELSQYLTWNIPKGTWKIYLYTEVVMKHFKYFENFIDPLNPEAVRCFLQNTHEQYKQYVGDEFGKTIKGIFTDEVTAFPPFHPWSPFLVERVKIMSGMDLTEYLPALSEEMGEITDKVRYAYWNAATEQFIDSWDKQIYEWCENNNLLYIGEKPILRSKELQYMHIPGIDAGHQKFGSQAILTQGKYRSNGKIASSAAHFYKKPAVLCEAFHSIGWGMTLQDAKWIFDWLTVMGIDWFITHGAYYTTDGLKKHDAPPSFFYQMPWWNHTHILTEYVEKLQKFLREGKRQVSVLVLDPITSTWTEIDQNLNKLKEDFSAFQNEMLKHGIDYYIIDPQLFAEGTVTKSAKGIRYENCGDSYNIIVLPFMTNLESGAVRMLQDYAEAGGTVLSVGTLPFKNLEGYDYKEWITQKFGIDPDCVYKRYFRNEHSGKGRWRDNCYFSSSILLAIREICRLEEKERLWKVKIPEDGEILQIQRSGEDDRKQLFLVNLTTNSQDVEVNIGDRTIVKTMVGGESTFLEVDKNAQWKLWNPNENERELMYTGDWKELIEEKEVITIPSLEIDITQKMPVQAVSENVLRIATWNMKTLDGQVAVVDSLPLIDQMEAAGLTINICQKDYFGCPKELEFPEIQSEYTYCFENYLEVGTSVSLVMEPGTLLGDWRLWVNDTMFCAEDFEERQVYMHSNLATEIGKALLNGENCIKLIIKSNVGYGGIRNPIYLCGKFSVLVKEQKMLLEAKLQKGSMDNLTSIGLPYYAGTVIFTRSITEPWINELPQDTVVNIVIKNEQFHEAVQLKVGNKEIGTCVYAPYIFQVSAGELQKYGEIDICMDTTLCRLFEGEYFNENLHEYEKVVSVSSNGYIGMNA